MEGFDYGSTYGERWKFELDGDGIQTPGQWEDLLFAYTRSSVNSSIVEDTSYTLSFVGNGADILRRRLVGPRTGWPTTLRIYYHNDGGRWELRYEGSIGDDTITDHIAYVEAGVSPVSVCNILIEQADRETDVSLEGVAMKLPRMQPSPMYAFTVAPDESQVLFKIAGTRDKYESVENYSRIQFDVDPSLFFNCRVLNNTANVDGKPAPVNEWMVRGADGAWIIAKTGVYLICVSEDFRIRFGKPIGVRGATEVEINGGTFLDTTNGFDLEDKYFKIIIGDHVFSRGGGSALYAYLNEGDVIKVSLYQHEYEYSIRTDLPTYDSYYVNVIGGTEGGIRIDPVAGMHPPVDPDHDNSPTTDPDIYAAVVRDTEVFTALCRKITRRPDLPVVFEGYDRLSAEYEGGATVLADMSNLGHYDHSGLVPIDPPTRATFRKLTLQQFYTHFGVMGYGVGVETDLDGNDLVRVAPANKTGVPSRFFPPENDALFTDLQDINVEIALQQWENTFTRVKAGSRPSDYGDWPREEGYGDPVNRSISYAHDTDGYSGGREWTLPWNYSTFALESALRSFENEGDEDRKKRRESKDQQIQVIDVVFDETGRYADPILYDRIEGQYYQPINMGWRPESLIRRLLPLLAVPMALYPEDNRVFRFEAVEGDTVPVTSNGEATGDQDLAVLPAFTTTDGTDTREGGNRPVYLPLVLKFNGYTGVNVFGILRSGNRYSTVGVTVDGKKYRGYLRSVQINPTRHSMQQWELFPVPGTGFNNLER